MFAPFESFSDSVADEGLGTIKYGGTLMVSNEGKELIQTLKSSITYQDKISAIVHAKPLTLNFPEVIQTLTYIAFNGERRQLRRTAVRLLGDIGAPESMQPLICVFRESPTPDVRLAAAEALGKIGDGSAVDALAAGLKDDQEDSYVRGAAAEALGTIAKDKGNDEATGALVIALADDNQEIADKIEEVLMKVGKPAIVPLVEALSDDNPKMLLRASTLLAKMVLAKMDKKSVVQPLIALLHSEKDEIVWRAVDLLGQIGDKTSVTPLIVLLMDKTKDSYERGEHVPGALAKIGDMKAVEPLIKMASKHAEDPLTVNSILALGDLGAPEAVDPLVAILKDEKTVDCHRLRLVTCWALRKLKDKKAMAILIEILRQARRDSYGLEDAAAEALAQIDDDGVELPLLRYLSERNPKDGVVGAVVSRIMGRQIDKSKGD